MSHLGTGTKATKVSHLGTYIKNWLLFSGVPLSSNEKPKKFQKSIDKTINNLYNL